MNYQTHDYRSREAGRTVRALLGAGVGLLIAVDIAADAYGLPIGEVLASWGAL